MTVIPLSHLMSAPPAGQMVARDSLGDMAFERFQMDVAGNAARLAALGCRRALLGSSDTYFLAVGLLAVLHAGAIPVFSSGNAGESLAEPGDAADLVVGDDDMAAFRLEPSDMEVATLMPLDAGRSVVGFYTSGSTGKPKLIAKPLRALEREVEALDRSIGGAADCGPVLATVPHHHVYGLTFKVLWPLCTGRPFSRSTGQHWEAIAADLTGGAVLVTGPSHLSRIGGLKPVPTTRRPAIVLSAGAPLAADAAREAKAVLGVPVTEIFGSSETGVIAHRPADGDEHPWRLFPGVTVAVGDGGRLRVRSPFLAGDGWHETGDLAEATADGFRLCGRGDRIAKIEGKRVSLVEIERRLANLPWVSAAAVAVLPGEPASLGAAVVLTGAGRERLETSGAFRFGRELRRALAVGGDASAMPRRWRFPEHLPVNAMGKRRDADIVALFSLQRPGATA